ncbi:DUF4222 domain-containing protein [Escherichia coli]
MSEDIPLPKVGQRYRDDHGALVTVTSVEETRVVFMRDGYPHPLHGLIFYVQQIEIKGFISGHVHTLTTSTKKPLD